MLRTLERIMQSAVERSSRRKISTELDADIIAAVSEWITNDITPRVVAELQHYGHPVVTRPLEQFTAYLTAHVCEQTREDVPYTVVRVESMFFEDSTTRQFLSTLLDTLIHTTHATGWRHTKHMVPKPQRRVDSIRHLREDYILWAGVVLPSVIIFIAANQSFTDIPTLSFCRLWSIPTQQLWRLLLSRIGPDSAIPSAHSLMESFLCVAGMLSTTITQISTYPLRFHAADNIHALFNFAFWDHAITFFQGPHTLLQTDQIPAPFAHATVWHLPHDDSLFCVDATVDAFYLARTRMDGAAALSVDGLPVFDGAGHSTMVFDADV